MASRRRATRRTLTTSLSDMQRRLRYVEARPNPTRLASQVVKRTNIEPRAVSTDQIALRSVTNTLIEEETLTENELAVDSVGSAELQSGAVTTESFAPGAVTQAALDTDSVGEDQLQVDSVGTSQIQNGSVGTDQLANGAVTNAKLANDSVSENKLQNNVVETRHIEDGAVTNDKILNGTITGSKIASNTIGAGQIAADAVGGSELADNSVTADNIANSAYVATGVFNSGGLLASFGANSSGHGRVVTFGADFGTALNEIPRGNHTHSFTISSGTSRISGADYTISGVPGHFHNYLDSYVSSISAPSSRRFKQNISSMVLEDPYKVLELDAKQFKYKHSMRLRQRGLRREWMYGYIVEDLQDLGLEMAVGYDKEGQPASIDYSVMTLLALESIKKLKSEVDELRERLNDKETQE